MKPYYEDGACTIYHGDCRDVLTRLDPCDLVLTDPPYGVTYESNRSSGRGRQPISNDGTRLSLWLYREVIAELRASHVLWFTRWDVWPDVWHLLGHHFRLRGLLVWDKADIGMGDLNHWGPSYELIASAGEGRTSSPREGSILRYRRLSTAARTHPTEKPPQLLDHLIQKVNPGTVTDPFMGTGSTLLAALRHGRRSVGIEVEERYCEIAAKRLSQEVLDFGGVA